MLGAALAAAIAGCHHGEATCTGEVGTVCTVIGNGAEALDLGDGTLALETPTDKVLDLTFGPDGNGYMIDFNNHRIRVWDAALDTLTTVCGSSIPGDGPEGPATATAMNHPTDVAFEPVTGNLVIAAWHNSRIKRVDLIAETVENTCGTGMRGFGGDGGPCEMAVLDLPSSVVYDSAGNLFISDQANNRIRVVDASGLIDTYAGTGLGTVPDPVLMMVIDECRDASVNGMLDCFTGDGGPALMATLNNPRTQSGDPAGRIDIDADDNLYVADTANHVVRRIDAATTVVTTVAGVGGMAGYAGDGGPATSALLGWPTDVAIDRTDGTLFIADTDSDCIRAVAPDGTISTAAGVCGTRGDDATAVPAGEAHFRSPYGVEVGPDRNVYISDTENNVVRVLYRFPFPAGG
jgi:DNA-binding beta-propeller fold protein YncE